MIESIRNCCYLSIAEFVFCCASVDVSHVCSFVAGLESAPPLEQIPACAMFSLTKRGLLDANGESLVLCKELSDCFRTIKRSERYIFVYQQQFDRPECILYGDKTGVVSIAPGRRKQEYVGVTVYGAGELKEWLSDESLLQAGNMPDDLLEAVQSESVLDNGAPDLKKFLQETIWSAGNEAKAVSVPEDISFLVESRRCSDDKLLSRLAYVRQPLFDRLVKGSEAGVSEHIYKENLLEQMVQEMLYGEEDAV